MENGWSLKRSESWEKKINPLEPLLLKDGRGHLSAAIEGAFEFWGVQLRHCDAIGYHWGTA